MAATNTLTLGATKFDEPGSEGSILFIGNATALIRVAGFTFLTDPTFIHRHEQTWLGYGLHTMRLTDPALEISALPPLDFVLLSHFHGDHFDQVAERELDKALPIVTTPESAIALQERGFASLHPLPLWDTLSVVKGGVRLHITATPARLGPPMIDFALPDVMGSIVDLETEAGDRFRLYITGDTLLIDELREILRRFPGIDVALLHLGGTRVLDILVSRDASQGVEAMPSSTRHWRFPSTTTTTTSSRPLWRISRPRSVTPASSPGCGTFDTATRFGSNRAGTSARESTHLRLIRQTRTP